MSVLSRIDFRAGTLTGTGGFGSLAGANSGSITVDSDDPGVGVYAANWPALSDAYGVETLADSGTVYAWVYLILDAAPAADHTLLQILANGAPIGEIVVTSSRTLLLKNNGTTIGSASSALTLGQLYRVGLRQQAGSGANGELEGYLAVNHKNLVSFASSTTQSFTASADELRLGAVAGSTFDGRIGLAMLRSDRFAGSWLDVHDVVVGPLGFMRQQGSMIAYADMQPAHDRAAIGERQHESYQNMSFTALANFGGGVGQSRMRSADRALTGIYDGRFDGYAFPPRKLQVAADGGSDSYYFDTGSNLYGIVGSTIQLIGSATTYSIPADLQNPRHQPVIDGQNNVYWVSSSNKIAKWTGSGSPVDVTPLGWDSHHVAQYERFIWAFSDATVPALARAQGNWSMTTTTATTREAALGTVPLENPYTLVFATVFIGGDGSNLGYIVNSTGWTSLGSKTVGTALKAEVFYKWGGGSASQSFSISVHQSTQDTAIRLDEFRGADPDTELTITFAEDAGTSTTLAVNGTAGDWHYAGIRQETNTTIAVEAGWTTISNVAGGGGDHHMDWRSSGDDTIQWSGLSGSSNKVGFHIAAGRAPKSGQKVFVILASDDAGQTWNAAPQNFAMDLFGDIRASVPVAERLWMVTDRGLFAMTGTGDETGKREKLIVVTAITQHDKWERPLTDNAGKWIASFQGQIYYPVGSTIRRYTPNSDDPNQERAFWPTAEWATSADKIQALVSNEGGLWWGSAGYLWNFNGRGFHQVAAEATAGDLDTMYWHRGNLYVKGAPAKYYKYGYPTIRPDILIDQGVLAATDFDTGYIITPSIDFEKVVEPKVVRKMYSQVSFTTQDANSGQITWHYRGGCGTDADPGVGSGGDLTATWNSWGTHAFADGGFHELLLTNPLQCYRLYVRATLTPGTSGIPVLHFFSIWGHAKLRAQKRMVVPAIMHTGQYDKENNVIFDDDSQVHAMVRQINTMREDVDVADSLTWTLFRKDGSDGGREYVVMFTQMEDAEQEYGEDKRRLTYLATMGFEELPG